MTASHIWVRAETRGDEQRTPLMPADALRLVQAGARVTVESCPYRIATDAEYRSAGCELTDAGSWVDAPADAVVLGIKELPDEPAMLRHTHVFFGHAYKGQAGAQQLLARFAAGGGTLLDPECLLEDGRRVVAFGHWAGYVGAALGVLQCRGRLPVPLHATSLEDLDAQLSALARGSDTPVRALVVGALGRSGRGARAALTVAGAQITPWDVEDTREVDRDRLLAHDLLVNCVVSTGPVTPLVRTQDLPAAGRRLRVVADVTCDLTTEHNLIPVNSTLTTWAEPVRRIPGSDPPLEVIAIDNLPSVLPVESSEDFSAQLTRLLPGLADRSGPWAGAQQAFDEALAQATGSR